MSDAPISLETLQALIASLCQEDTAAGSGKGWTMDNPTHGHCTIVAAVVQRLFGGDLMRASLEGTEFAEYSSHYWNRLPDDSEIDLTEDQFQGRLQPIEDLEPIVRDRSYALGASDAGERYAKFSLRLAEKLDPNNSLFADDIYRECILQALQSPCQKMGKGAVIATDEGDIIHSDYNRFQEGLEDMCTPECIRMTIASRTDSMIGACGHAEEALLWEASRDGLEMSFLHVYVATTGPNGLPLFERPRPEFTCIRCAVQMVNANLGSVNVIYDGQWHRQSPQEALKSSAAYALGDKKI